VAPIAGTDSCQVEHIGLVVSGEAVAKMDDGREIVMREGDLFAVPPGHDSWVVGDQPYVSLHFLGSENYGS
jgi:quercetin dioxygenase-like cupin family protein